MSNRLHIPLLRISLSAIANHFFAVLVDALGESQSVSWEGATKDVVDGDLINNLVFVEVN